MTNYSLLKLKPGKLAIWKAWCGELMTTYKEEACSALIEENLVKEGCHTFETKDGDYVLYAYEVAPGSVKLPQKLERELNRKHKAVVEECFERVYIEQHGGYSIEKPL